jgi:hypothetical protein
MLEKYLNLNLFKLMKKGSRPGSVIQNLRIRIQEANHFRIRIYNTEGIHPKVTLQNRVTVRFNNNSCHE